ncbi:MAG: DUF488 domain-containing protein [Burkholderiaceae bacterium]|nr:DUF488 domain-containing protein [Burkholderiaceae bacterium]
MTTDVQIRRAYEAQQSDEGYRVLVDRLWPRGIAKADLTYDLWCKDLAPSAGLRQWFDHQVEKWPEFSKRYRAELQASEQQVRIQEIVKAAKGQRITLIYGAKDREHNQAVVLAAEIKGT